MSKPSGELKFTYDNYDDDFHQESHEKAGKNDFNMQTSGIHKNEVKEEKYDDDFHQEEAAKKSKVLVRRDDASTREKMIEQNIKLKTQIYELAKKMDEIMAKQKKKKNYGIHADEEEDQVIKEKKMELKRQQIEIMQLKNKIFLTKRQLQHVYDSRGIQGKEDELKALQKELKALQSEKDGLVRIKKQQTKALKVIRNDNEYEEKISKLKEQLSKIKEQCKILSDKLMENERTLRKNHEQYITKQNKIKEMETKIEENKKKVKKGQPSNIVTVEMIGQIEQQINQLQKERKESQKSWNEKIQNIDNQLHQRRMEEEKKLLILKEKEKQLKLNQIRIKELKKLIQHHHSEMNANRKQQSQQADMKQFRHKRNIKYLEKQ